LKGGWIRDWKPGPLPTTPEQRASAAKKYNLIPEDYETYPDGEGYGDYPKLPVVGQDARDPYEDFDWHYRRRNFGEPVLLLYSFKSIPNI
jgi:NADH dehydrogenase (ubiquinone) 1 beta subcomplex subunit 8